jgi:hypothetical protein
MLIVADWFAYAKGIGPCLAGRGADSQSWGLPFLKYTHVDDIS